MDISRDRAKVIGEVWICSVHPRGTADRYRDPPAPLQSPGYELRIAVGDASLFATRSRPGLRRGPFARIWPSAASSAITEQPRHCRG